MRSRPLLAFFLATSCALSFVFLPAAAVAGKADEAAIKAIVFDEIRPGILRESPDLYLKSYLPLSTVFSFGSGPVDSVRYREVLVAYFAVADPKTLDCEVLYLTVTGNDARMAVKFSETGTRQDGSGYAEVFKRYYHLVKVDDRWKVETDGYNDSLRKIQRMHDRPTGFQ